MPNYIPPDFTPSEQSYNNLRKHGCIPEFVDDQLPLFITYWEELKEKKSAKGRKESWQMTLQRWMRSAWSGKAGRDWEYTRHKRNGYGGLKDDLFNGSATRTGGQASIPARPSSRSKLLAATAFNPPDLGTMTREEGLKALAELQNKLK